MFHADDLEFHIWCEYPRHLSTNTQASMRRVVVLSDGTEGIIIAWDKTPRADLLVPQTFVRMADDRHQPCQQAHGVAEVADARPCARERPMQVGLAIGR